jgi:hypothetical protein
LGVSASSGRRPGSSQAERFGTDGPEQTTGGEDGRGSGGAARTGETDYTPGAGHQAFFLTHNTRPCVWAGPFSFFFFFLFSFSFSVFFVLFKICDGGGGVDWRLKDAGKILFIAH